MVTLATDGLTSAWRKLEVGDLRQLETSASDKNKGCYDNDATVFRVGLLDASQWLAATANWI